MSETYLKSAAVTSVVIDYPARDMTITVGGGITVGELQQRLAVENQQLPIDVADDAMTVGEMVADDISGPRQFGYGTLRDYVIGIEAVDGQGRVFHAGGRVVKNVAGYDLCRLLVGSRGELGLITQLTFKLKPLPVQQSLVAAGFRSLRDLESALERLNLTATTPVIMDVVSRFAAVRLMADSFPDLVHTSQCSDVAAVLIVGFEGPAVACDWQVSMLQDELLGTALWSSSAMDSTAFPRYCRAALSATVVLDKDPWMARLTTLPSRVVSAITLMQEAGCEVFGRAGNGVMYVRPMNGISDGAMPVDESTGIGHLQSLVADGVGCVDVIKSASSRSTVASKPVQVISQKLHDLLGWSTGPN